MSYLASLIFAIALCASYVLGYTPLYVSVIYIVLSLVTFLAYARDKSAAQNGAWRVPERTLHLLALAGGWPGAMLAQRTFRHKTRKDSFRIGFWTTVLANGGALAWLHTSGGAVYLNTLTFQLEDLVLKEMESGIPRTILLNLLGFHA